MTTFKLDKWYMDATDDEGRVFVGYHALISWKLLRLRYSGFIFSDGRNPVQQKSSFRKKSEIIFSPHHLSWESSDIKATWKLIDKPVNELLLENGGKKVFWECLFPKAIVQIEINNKIQMQGTGYAERLTMNIPPWTLPVREIRWGRFLSQSCSIIWIEWRGSMPKISVYHNGKKINNARIDDDSISFDSLCLKITEKKILRSGSLLSTAFPRFPWMKKYFPVSALMTEETKWVSFGTLEIHGSVNDTGTVIHEKVIWL